MNRVRQLSAAGLLGLVMIFELAAFALLSLRDESFDYKALAFAGGLIAVLLLQYIIILWISKYADRFILVIANLLAGIGMIVQYRLSYEVAFKQLVWFGIGIVAMIACVLLMRAPKFFRTMNIPLMALSVAVLGVLLCTRYALQSLGQKVLPLFSSVIELVGKVIFVLVFIPRYAYNAVILCEPIIWCFMAAYLVAVYRRDAFVYPKKNQ